MSVPDFVDLPSRVRLVVLVRILGLDADEQTTWRLDR